MAEITLSSIPLGLSEGGLWVTHPCSKDAIFLTYVLPNLNTFLSRISVQFIGIVVS